jgi:hypothetical protein
VAPELEALRGRYSVGYGQERIGVAVFVAFSDEADVGNKHGDFVVCGYVADERDWPDVASAWQERVLDGPPKLPYFHTNPLKTYEWRQEHGIGLNDAECRIDEAVRVLASMGAMSALGSIIKKGDLDVFARHFGKKKQIPLGLNEPDYFCFIAYAVLVLGEVYKNYPSAERVNFVVSRKQKITHHLHGFRDDIEEWLKVNYPHLASLIGDLIPASMEEQLPLQAADLLGWHIQRNCANRLDATDYRRLCALVQASGTTFEWKRSHLEEMLKGSLARLFLRQAKRQYEGTDETGPAS